MRQTLAGLGAACALVLGFWSTDANAQAAASKEAAATSGALEEIVVSARRRKETVQETPIAMTAIATSQMESVAITRVSDIQGTVPNLLITQQVTGGSATNTSLRGLSFADIEKSFDPTVAVVVDGAFIGTSTGQLLDFFDIASIEVLRGPQGTLFGRNTIGGVINVTRTKPTDEFTGNFDVEYSRFNTVTGRGVVSLPIVKGVLDAKFFLFHTTTDGYYYNATLDQPGGSGRNTNFGASFLWTPNDKFNALLTLEEQRSVNDNVVANITKSGELFCIPLPFNPPPAQLAVQCNRNNTTDIYTVFGPKNEAIYNSPAATLEMNWDAGFAKFVSLTNFRRDTDSSIENVASFVPSQYFVNRQSTYHQFSQEFRASGNIVPTLDYVAGLYYFNSVYELNQHTGGTLFGLPTFPTDTYQSQDTIGKSTSTAAFADFDWEFVPKWRVNFGGRVTHDKKELDTSAPFGGAFTNFGDNTASFTKFTPKVSVDFRPTDDHMVYVSYSKGYRSGGFSGRGLDPVSATTPYNPETVSAYEIGAKTAWFERRLLFNVAVFYTDYKDIQETITQSGGSTGNITIVKNAAAAKVKGVEVDFTAKPFEPVTLRGSLGYLKSNFEGFLNAEAWSCVPSATNTCPNGTSGLHTYDYSDVNLIYAPKITGSLNVDYAVPTSYGKWNATLGWRYIGPYDQQIARDDSLPVVPDNGTTVLTSNDPRVRSNVQNLLDASLALHVPMGGGNAEFAIFGRNLADSRGTASAFTVAGLWSFATAREPRTYGVRLGYKF